MSGFTCMVFDLVWLRAVGVIQWILNKYGWLYLCLYHTYYISNHNTYCGDCIERYIPTYYNIITYEIYRLSYCLVRNDNIDYKNDVYFELTVSF